MSGKKLTVRDLCYCAVGAALLAVCAWLSIPFTIPFTLQSFGVCLIAALLGLRRGTLSVLIYILLGAAGLPVFSGFRAGLGALLGVTGGYLFGYLLTTPVVAYAAERFPGRVLPLASGMLLGMLLCYVCGTAWFMIVYTRSSGAIGVLRALNLCVFPFLLPDALKCALALFLALRLRPHIR